MELKILSLNCGVPKDISWNGKSISSSMGRQSVSGPLVVHKNFIEGNSFSEPNLHGKEHSVLYAYGMKSIMSYMNLFGHSEYEYGSLGENITLDDLDETKISIGDIFEIGEVLAQATYPRIPCVKLNFRMQHPKGQKYMQECGRSGVYFRILKSGRIFKTDRVKLVKMAQNKFMISDYYKKYVGGAKFTKDDLDLAMANEAFPRFAIEKIRTRLGT